MNKTSIANLHQGMKKEENYINAYKKTYRTTIEIQISTQITLIIQIFTDSLHHKSKIAYCGHLFNSVSSVCQFQL